MKCIQVLMVFCLFLAGGSSSFFGSGNAYAGAYDDMLNAVSQKDEAQVSELLARGMDVNTSDQKGNTLLMLAARRGDQSILELLLRNKANTLNKNKYGDSALMLAALGGHLPAVSSLVAAGADLDPQGWTPLIYAAFNGHADTVKFLLQKKAHLDAQSGNGTTALMAACRNGHLEVVKTLLEQGANIHLLNYANQTALDLARVNKNSEILSMLDKAATQGHSKRPGSP